jgi:hypothetical protein
MTDKVNHGFDFLTRHSIYSFSCGVWRHCPIIRVQTRICTEVELWIVELSIQILYWSSLFSAFSDDTQDCCGVLQFRIPRFTEYLGPCAPLPCTPLSGAPWWDVIPTTHMGTLLP